MHDSLFVASHLNCTVAGRVLWRDVSFSLEPGAVMGLVSPSGTGKTLLLRQLVLLDPTQGGTLYLNQRTPSQWTIPVYRTQVMYLPQRPTMFFGTGLENLQQPFRWTAHRHRRFNPAQIEQWLQQLGRTFDWLQRPGTELSGGEMQILALLRALQLEPQILLLDEPSASIDPDTTAQIEQLLTQWLQQPNKACMLTSHNPNQIQRMTHQLLDLREFAP